MHIGTVWWKFSFENSCFFVVFGHLEIIFRPFAQRFSKPLSEVLLTVQRKILRKLLVWKNLFFLYLQYRAKKFWHFVVESFSVVWKMAFYVSRSTIWGRMCLLFWKKSFFFRFRTSRFFLRLQANHFWQCCQKCIPRVHRKILRKNTFCRRKK